ncbi:MAG: hypothetical protein ABI383_11435 [Acidobacteriaceae bacterium]
MRLLCLLLILTPPALAQSPRSYHIFRGPDTLFTENDTLTCDETWESNNLFLLCRDNSNDREIFRLAIGDRRARFRDYGIEDQADFNADGKPDFTLYTADHSAQHFYLELSSPHGYHRIDLGATINRAWKLHHHSSLNVEAAPDSLEDIRLLRSGHALSLSVTIAHQGKITIPESEFVRQQKR